MAARGFAAGRLRFVVAGCVLGNAKDDRAPGLSVVELPANSCAAFTQQ